MESLIDYSRQSEFNRTFESQLQGWNHAIIGCGGVGFWLGIILAMQGYQNFALFDGQILETTNMNRIPVPPQWIGFKKVTALRRIIKSLRPESAIVNFPHHVTPENLDILGRMVKDAGVHFIIWDCTDDARIQRKVYDWSRTNNIVYRKIGYEGFTVGSYKNYDVWTSEDYQPGYRTSNACAASSAFAAVMGFMAQGLGVQGDVNIDIRRVLEDGQKPVEKAYEAPTRVIDFDRVQVDDDEEDDDEDDDDQDGVAVDSDDIVDRNIGNAGIQGLTAMPQESGVLSEAGMSIIRREQQRMALESEARRRMEQIDQDRERIERLIRRGTQPDPVWINPSTLPNVHWGETTNTND